MTRSSGPWLTMRIYAALLAPTLAARAQAPSTTTWPCAHAAGAAASTTATTSSHSAGTSPPLPAILRHNATHSSFRRLPRPRSQQPPQIRGDILRMRAERVGETPVAVRIDDER